MHPTGTGQQRPFCVQRELETLGQRHVLETTTGVVRANPGGRGFIGIYPKIRLGLARVGEVRRQAGAADDPAAQWVPEFAAELAQRAALRMPAAHGLAQPRIDAPEIGGRVLDEAAYLSHVRYIAQTLQRAVGGASLQVIDIGAGGETVGVQRAPGQAVIGAQADIAPVQIQVRHGPCFIAAAGGVVGLVAEARAHFASDCIGPDRAGEAAQPQ
ncbi:hypothetical protein [Pseudomonas sp. 52 E 6]|nr:hypothetical protein [Pseudomonas sp. 52 E 6]